MSNLVRAGYMGLADLGGTQVRCTSFGVNPNQDVLFYNHVIGLKDTVPTDNATKGENLGATYANIQRRIWRPSPISIAGGISFPATETGLNSIFALARYANYFDINFNYYCSSGTTGDNVRLFTGCRINGFDLSVVAGDIVNINTDVVCKNVSSSTSSASYRTPQKIVTWDKVQISLSGAPFSVTRTMIQGFSFKINNNIQTIYTATSGKDTASLLPTDLRVGMQEVTGNLTVYIDAGKEFIPIDVSSPATLTVIMPTLTLRMTVIFKSNQMEGQVGPIMTQLPFVGVDYSFL